MPLLGATSASTATTTIKMQSGTKPIVFSPKRSHDNDPDGKTEDPQKIEVNTVLDSIPTSKPSLEPNPLPLDSNREKLVPRSYRRRGGYGDSEGSRAAPTTTGSEVSTSESDSESCGSDNDNNDDGNNDKNDTSTTLTQTSIKPSTTISTTPRQPPPHNLATPPTSTPTPTPTPRRRAQNQPLPSHPSIPLSNLRPSDRLTLQHLPPSQQRALLATQHKQMEKSSREANKGRGRVEGAGNLAGRLGSGRLIRVPPHFGMVGGLKR